MVFEANRK